MVFRGKIISFSGIDGCGKTTIIDMLRRELRDRGMSSTYAWLRYNHYLTRLLLAFCRIARLTRYEYVNGVRIGYHEFYRSKIISTLFVISTFFDTLLASLITVYLPALFTRNIIICDRWVHDILVDLEIDTRFPLTSDKNLYNRIFRWLIPAGAVCFVVKRDYAAVMNARQEHSVDRNFSARYRLYENIYNDPRICVLDNTASITNAVKQASAAL